jgi:hypothetical protein
LLDRFLQIDAEKKSTRGCSAAATRFGLSMEGMR